MALKSTIYKADVQIADMDRNYYQTHALTLARHPSETDERMMMRLLAFIRHASDSLAFGKGLSDVQEPDLWQKDLTGEIGLWIEVGQPDERALLKACGRAGQVVVYSYAPHSTLWRSQLGSRIDRMRNLQILNVAADTSAALASLAQRGMQLQCTIQDGQIWITDQAQTVQVEVTEMLPAPGKRSA